MLLPARTPEASTDRLGARLLGKALAQFDADGTVGGERGVEGCRRSVREVGVGGGFVVYRVQTMQVVFFYLIQ